MNLRLLLLLVWIDLFTRIAFGDDLPKPFTFSRYQGMTDRSPFAVATAVAPVAAAPNFAKDLYVANAARSADGDLVTIASSSDKNFKKYLTTKTPVDGYSISNIEWSDKVGATKVTIAKDGQFATLTFNQAILSQPIASAQNPNPVPPPEPAFHQRPVPGQQGAPVPPGAPVTLPNPMPVPSLPPTLPRTRGVIPRNPNSSPAPNIGVPPPNGDDR